MDSPKKLDPALVTIIIVVLVGIVASVSLVIHLNQPGKNDTSQSTGSDAVTQTSHDAYKDGTYSALGSYVTPGGIESIQVTVTIKDNKIVATELTENANDGDAKEHQDAFAAEYESLVVGKSVNEVSLSRVAGASLTSNGFNKALEQIKDDAAA